MKSSNKKLIQDASKKLYRVEPGARAHLNKFDCNGRDMLDVKKKHEKEIILELNDELDRLQELLYAEHKHKILVVLQAMDTAGKDGVIRHVFKGVNPQGTRVASFKAPTTLELDHDYLWRIHQQVPGKGEIVIFNRSHYEDVLITRVHELVPRVVWRKRYQQINDFERMLSEEGVTILKFFLHIDKDEQKKRLQARLDDPAKQWKFRLGDLDERKLWDDYMKAYQDVLNETSTKYAPWYVVPANRKWYRDLVISTILVETLKDLKMNYPAPQENLNGVVIE
jgi:PPK2 family polyphosphate:nucleotide phosphotransferase